MKIDALQRYQKLHRQGRFDDLPYRLHQEAERILRRLCARRQGNVPRWLFAILCGVSFAGRTSTHSRPADASRRSQPVGRDARVRLQRGGSQFAISACPSSSDRAGI